VRSARLRSPILGKSHSQAMSWSATVKKKRTIRRYRYEGVTRRLDSTAPEPHLRKVRPLPLTVYKKSFQLPAASNQLDDKAGSWELIEWANRPISFKALSTC
jgi:hypothetical protein